MPSKPWQTCLLQELEPSRNLLWCTHLRYTNPTCQTVYPSPEDKGLGCVWEPTLQEKIKALEQALVEKEDAIDQDVMLKVRAVDCADAGTVDEAGRSFVV